MKDFTIHTKQDLEDAVNTLGFLPFFENSVPGFSVEEHVDRSCWWHGTSGEGFWPVWEWKGPVVKETGCAYGKFFEHKAAFVSAEWFPDFANYRRDGYDMDARYDDGLAAKKDLELWETVRDGGPLLTQELKLAAGYGKGGKKGFETVIPRLQAQCYVTVADFVYRTDKNGNRFGWGVSQYDTPENQFGQPFCDAVYAREPAESLERLLAHFHKLLPDASDTALRKFLG